VEVSKLSKPIDDEGRQLKGPVGAVLPPQIIEAMPTIKAVTVAAT
jgi:hypothetical protein